MVGADGPERFCIFGPSRLAKNASFFICGRTKCVPRGRKLCVARTQFARMRLLISVARIKWQAARTKRHLEWQRHITSTNFWPISSNVKAHQQVKDNNPGMDRQVFEAVLLIKGTQWLALRNMFYPWIIYKLYYSKTVHKSNLYYSNVH